MRREFQLPERDVEFLDASGRDWETLRQGGQAGGWLLIYRFPIFPGYNQPEVMVALQITPSYDTTEIDMAYVFPALSRTDGKGIPNLTFTAIDGRQFQRWSRHRSGDNRWRPGVDYVGTHLGLVESWFEREFTVRP